ncbi:glycosyltransferase family 2 protein [Gammaproteobacteria bacterium]|nr:glycosyltransferase family 2 protein [Gammaproteobacteria bacterium]
MVSILMPSFNSEEYIERAIVSVVSQSYERWELLICDDGSSDSSIEIAAKWAARDERIIALKNCNNKGAAGARNTCLNVARGRYIAFLDSDDLWLPDKLTLQLNFMRSESIAFSFSYHCVIDERDNQIASFKAPNKVDASLMRYSNFIPCLTAMYDTKILGKVIQPNIKKRNDFALWLKILNSGKVKHAHCLPVVTAKYRANSYGLSSKKLDTLHYYKICLKEFGGLSQLDAVFFSAIYAILGTVKAKIHFLYNYLVVKL